MSLPLLRLRAQSETPALDMGQGRTLSAEDLLDGHFRRMTTAATARTVQVQVDDQLRSAITVLAPELSPLTHLAEELVGVVGDVRPEPHFRAELQRALEQTHRQHTAQRVLGTRPTGSHDGSTASWWTALAAFGLVLLLSGLWLVRSHRSHPA